MVSNSNEKQIGLWKIKELLFKKQKESIDIDTFILSVLDKENAIITGEDFLVNIEKTKKDQIVKLINRILNKRNNKKYEKILDEIIDIINGEIIRIVNTSYNDIGDIRQELINELDNVDFTLKYNFYYDETNNYRKFYINKSGKFNQPIDRYFVLGGICLEFDQQCNFESLMQDLKMQKNTKEIKAHHIFKSPDLLECLNSKKLNVMLQWIYDNKIYLHFEAVDHMYILASDIASIICNDESEIVFFSDIIYKLIQMDTEKVLYIMSNFNYPQISEQNIESFLQAWKDYINYCKEIDIDKNNLDKITQFLMYDSIIKRLNAVQNTNNFENREFIIEKYDIYYQTMPILFLDSYHIFDEELEIQKELLKNANWTIKGKTINNYTFINSVNNKMVQISDVMVALFSRFLTYVGGFEIGEKTTISLLKLRNSLKTQTQCDNFLLLTKIMKDSYEKNQQFFRLHGCFSKKNTIDLLVGISEITKEGILLKN